MMVQVPRGSERNAYLPLFRLADDSEEMIRGYYLSGELYGLMDEETGAPHGEVLVLPVAGEAGTAELKSVAISDERQGQGLGKQMITQVLERLRASGVRRVLVGTSNASLDALAFYQKVGFRLWRIERDYFSAEKGYGPECVEDGIPVRDMIWLERALDKALL